MAEHESKTTKTTFEILTKAELTRDWNSIEPKVVAFFSTGGLLTIAAYVAGIYGFHFQGWQEAGIIWLSSTIAGYITKSTVKVPTAVESKAQEQVSATLVSEETPSFEPIVTTKS